MLETRRNIEEQSTLVIEEPTYPEQLLKIGKAALQNEHLVLDIGGSFLQQPCPGVYLIKTCQRASVGRRWMMPTRAAFGPLSRDSERLNRI